MLNRLISFFKKKESDHYSGEKMMGIFRTKYANFKTLLESNSELLKIISDIEEKLQGQTLFGMSYIRSQTARLTFHTARMIKSFESLSAKTFSSLTETLENIQHHIREESEHKSVQKVSEYVLPYTQVTHEMVDFVGGKNANLGEVLSRVKLPIPHGFAITTAAFDRVLEFNGLTDEIRKLKMEIDAADPQSISEISEEIQRLFMNAAVPPDLEQKISESYAHLMAVTGYDEANPLKVALRSSALGEDSELSFAGQYLSVLNVPPENMMKEYRQVLASLFSPRAILYRLHKGIPFEEAAMSVACLEMLDSVVSGVMYSRHPFNYLEDKIIINAVWGLGPYAVDGVVTPDTYTLSKTSPPVLLKSEIFPKKVRLVTKSDGYLVEEQVAPECLERSCLSEKQAITLAEYALKLEAHFQCPQDVEWALDDEDNLIILQSRPLRIEAEEAKADNPPIPGYTVLLEEGSIACPGVGCGHVHRVMSENDLASFPDGGVLVAPHSSPQFVMVMPRAQAILTDSGSVTGHMASLAREFKVPALLNTHKATTVLKQGETVTVDGYTGRVYQGKVPELLEMKLHKGAFMKETPVYNTLRKLADFILPLNLTDPKSASFTPRNCKTVHDIMRLIHELSYQELFQIGDLVSAKGSLSLKLSAPLPIDLYLIDLGDGLKDVSARASKVKPEQIASAPFKALLDGMLKLKYLEPRPVEFKGFMSVMSQQMLSSPYAASERFGDKSYAIISDKYLNFSSRVGYHYSVLDAYCGLTNTKNYVNFQFKGGAADDVRKNRRVRLIQKLLETIGFLTEVQGDRVWARFAKREAEATAERLDYLGRLLIFTRQLDMLMYSEDSVSKVADCFINGDYNLHSMRKRN
jgi:pyruvate,water dikinase